MDPLPTSLNINKTLELKEEEEEEELGNKIGRNEPVLNARTPVASGGG